MLAGVGLEHPITAADEFAGKPGVVRFLEPLARRFVMIDGTGPAGEAAFLPRMPGLYTTVYKLRFALKARGFDEKVRPLEGLWWTEDGLTDLDAILGKDADRSTWRWTLLIGLPEAATDDEVAAAVGAGRAKLEPPHAANLRVERFAEGPCAQILHLGPYATERPTIEALHTAIEAAGLAPTGRHHEVYLGDPQRSAPERLKTLIRMPVRPD
jgi:hypothetical protein